MNEGLNGKSWIWPLFGRTVSIAFLTLDHKSKYRLRSSLGTATSHFWHKSKWSLTDLRCGTDLSTKTQNSKNNFTHMSRQPKPRFQANEFLVCNCWNFDYCNSNMIRFIPFILISFPCSIEYYRISCNFPVIRARECSSQIR